MKIRTLTLFIIGIGIMSTSIQINVDYGLFRSWWPMHIGLAIAFLPLYDLHAYYDSKRTILGWHVKRAILRGALMTGVAIMIIRPNSLESWVDAASIVAYLGGLFYATFNHLYNYYAEKKSLYLGNQSLMDNLFRKKPIWQVFIQVILLLGSLAWFYWGCAVT